LNYYASAAVVVVKNAELQRVSTPPNKFAAAPIFHSDYYYYCYRHYAKLDSDP
jgi:hypothetical protein